MSRPNAHRLDPPHVHVERLPPGESPVATVLPGDIGLVYDHAPTLVHELIWARTRQEVGESEWANLTHSFGVTDAGGTIMEGVGEGWQQAHISKYKGMDYWLIRPQVALDRRMLCAQRWLEMKGAPYDKLAFVSEGMLCFGWPFSIRSVNKAYDCAAGVCYGALAYVLDFPRPFDLMTPADLGLFFQLPIDSPPRPLSLVGRLLDRVVTAGRLIDRLIAWPYPGLIKRVESS